MVSKERLDPKENNLSHHRTGAFFSKILFIYWYFISVSFQLQQEHSWLLQTKCLILVLEKLDMMTFA